MAKNLFPFDICHSLNILFCLHDFPKKKIFICVFPEGKFMKTNYDV